MLVTPASKSPLAAALQPARPRVAARPPIARPATRIQAQVEDKFERTDRLREHAEGLYKEAAKHENLATTYAMANIAGFGAIVWSFLRLFENHVEPSMDQAAFGSRREVFMKLGGRVLGMGMLAQLATRGLAKAQNESNREAAEAAKLKSMAREVEQDIRDTDLFS